MNEILDAVTIGDIIGLLAGIGAIWATIKWVRPFVRGALDVFDAWNGRPARPGFEAIPGVMEQLSNLRDDVEIAKTLAHDAAESAADASYHSKPNHGGSAYDAVIRRLDDLEASNTKTVQVVKAALTEHAALQARADEQSEIIRAVAARPDVKPEEG